MKENPHPKVRAGAVSICADIWKITHPARSFKKKVTSMNKKTDTKPPQNTQWIISRLDLPRRRGGAHYEVQHADGKRETITLSNRKRQVLDALMRAPVYCASPVRLSDIVLLLRNENGINIETEFFQENDGIENTRFGIYVLVDQVRYRGEVSTVASPAVESEAA